MTSILTQDRLDQYAALVAQVRERIDARQQQRVMLLAATKDALPATEDYDAVRADLVNTLLESFRSYVSASRGRASEISAKRSLIKNISAAFYRGYKVAGGEVTEPEDETWLTDTQKFQLDWMDKTFDSLKAQRDTESATVDALTARAEDWGVTLDGIYSEGKLRGRINIMLTFDGDDGDESCRDCQRLKGKRHSAKWWVKRDLVRRSGNPAYECGRWDNCHHHFYTDDGELYAE